MKTYEVNVQTGPHQFATMTVTASTMQEAWKKATDMNRDAVVMAIYTR